MPRHFYKAMMNPRYEGHLYKLTNEFKMEKRIEKFFYKIISRVKNVLR